MSDAMPTVAGVTHRTVTIDGARGPVSLHVAEAGDVDGEPIVLLHGWPQHWYCWRGLLPALAERHRVLMPDLRGFGWSEAPGYGYEPDTFAADTIALLDACGIDRVRLVGHDWGGFTAFLLAVTHPDRFSRAVVINAPPMWTALSWRIVASLWRTWYVSLLASPVGARVAADPRFVPWFIGLGGRRDVFAPDDARSYAQRMRDPARSRASSKLYRSYLRFAVDVFLRRRWRGTYLNVPTLLLFGQDDFYIPLSYLAGYAPNAPTLQVELVPGCGHFLPEERPELAAQRILEFMDP